MRVPCIAAPLFKSRLEGRGKVSKELFHARQRDDLAQQIALLQHAAGIARLFGTNLVRCFSFWRVGDDPTAVWDRLLEPFYLLVQEAAKEDVILVMENDFECNLGRGRDAARFIEQINSLHLRLLWDCGNAYFAGEIAFPDGYQRAKHLIGHVHIKDAARDAITGQPYWVALGSGEVDLPGQLRAFETDGYRGVITIENYYLPTGGTKEDGVRESFAGLQRLLNRKDHSVKIE